MPVGNHNYSLLTDLYQLTMAQGYWECNKLEEEACFHAFFRTNPFHGGYAIACGTDHVSPRTISRISHHSRLPAAARSSILHSWTT